MGYISVSNVVFGYDADNVLLDGVCAVINDTDKVAIVGANGSGKTTFLRLLAGDLQPDSGQVVRNTDVYVVKQINSHGTKSGGETQAFELGRALDSGAGILLLDEPTNNLDADAKQWFIDKMHAYSHGVVMVSHDRELLGHVDKIIELEKGKIKIYGGNYDFWVGQKQIMRESMQNKYVDAEKEINRLIATLGVAQNTCQHHNTKQAKDKQNRASGSRIEANALKGKSQETEAKKRAKIQAKINRQIEVRQELGRQMKNDKIKIPVPNKKFYSKELVRINAMNFAYGDKKIFQNFDFVMYGGNRVRLCGKNGSGKTTLLKIITGQLELQSGSMQTFGKIAYLNQDLSILDKNKSLVENVMDIAGVRKHEAHAVLANFGFRGDETIKRVGVLSGGELLKATLAVVLGGENQPDLLILDEPTNNLEIDSIEILEDALNQYQGAILLVTHDQMFAQNINVDSVVQISSCYSVGA